MRTALEVYAPPATRAGVGTSPTDAGTAAARSEMSRSETAHMRGAWQTGVGVGVSTASASSQATAESVPAAARMTRVFSPSTTSTGTEGSTERASVVGLTVSGWTSSSAGFRPSTRCFATTATPAAPSMAAPALIRIPSNRLGGSRVSTARLSAGSASDDRAGWSSRRLVADRHTALGDAKWARAIYDAITGGDTS